VATCIFSVLRRKVHSVASGRFPGSEFRQIALPDRFCLPRRSLPSGLEEATIGSSQWRDRAGFAPDFPLCPRGYLNQPRHHSIRQIRTAAVRRCEPTRPVNRRSTFVHGNSFGGKLASTVSGREKRIWLDTGLRRGGWRKSFRPCRPA